MNDLYRIAEKIHYSRIIYYLNNNDKFEDRGIQYILNDNKFCKKRFNKLVKYLINQFSIKKNIIFTKKDFISYINNGTFFNIMKENQMKFDDHIM
jgi:hypothetical protein